MNRRPDPQRSVACDLFGRERDQAGRPAHDRPLDQSNVERLLPPPKPESRRIENTPLAVEEGSASGKSEPCRSLRGIDEWHLRVHDIDAREHREHGLSQIRRVQVPDRLAEVPEPGKIVFKGFRATKIPDADTIHHDFSIGRNVEVLFRIAVRSKYGDPVATRHHALR